MMRFSARMMPVVVLLLVAPTQAQTKQFPAFDPERIFMLGDADLDGRHSLDEYRDFLRSSARMKGAAATIERSFRRLDVDRDGFLSLAEYRKSFQRRTDRS
jgi:Ca2+-binding EF-hand superfamily protein